MANPNSPFGLLPVGVARGSADIIPMRAATADVIYIQDAVNRLNDGTIEADSATPGTTLYCGIALETKAATVAGSVMVYADKNAVFWAQNSGSFALADEGLNANLVLTAGNSTTKYSKHAINTATLAVTGTLDVRVRRLAPLQNNVVGNYAVVECTWNGWRDEPGTVGL